MRIGIASDHAGVELKQTIASHLLTAGNEVSDFGPQDTCAVDYPDQAVLVARAVALGDCDRGILICGTGIGMSIAANKLPGIRAALCRDELSARASRQHNDANILVLGARVTGPDLALAITDQWMVTGFDGGRHRRRVDKIHLLERGEGAGR